MDTITNSLNEIYMKQKLSVITKFDMTDADGNSIYHVAANLTGFTMTVTNALGEEIATIKKKVSVVPTYDAVFSNGNSISLKKKFALTKQEFDGSYNDKSFHVTGNFIAFDCNVSIDGETIGTIKKEMLHLTDTYKITAVDSKWLDVMAVATICIDGACHNSK